MIDVVGQNEWLLSVHTFLIAVIVILAMSVALLVAP